MSNIDKLISALKLTRSEAEILWILYVKGTVVSSLEITELTGRPCDSDAEIKKSDRVLRVLLTKMRKKLPEGAIESRYGRGYLLVNPVFVFAVVGE